MTAAGLVMGTSKLRPVLGDLVLKAFFWGTITDIRIYCEKY
jgi:hypothetical protein